MRRYTSRLTAAAMSVALALAGVVLGSPVRAAAAPPGADAGADARAEHQRIVDFWTPDRVARAIPRDYVGDPATGRFSLQPERTTSGGGSGGGTSSGVLGATWTQGGLVQRTTGRVLFSMSGTYYVCSASVVQDTDTATSVVLTAGHCAYDEAGRQFAQNWMFVPDYADAPVTMTANGSFCSQTVYGCWTAQALTVDKAFTDQTTFNTTATLNDFAFATVGVGGKGLTQLDATVGSQAIGFSTVAAKTTVDLFGYPAAQPYNGTQLIYSEGPLGFDPNNGGQTYRVASSLNGGSSGGPWYASFAGATGAGTTMSVNSYRYSGKSYMQGPVLNSTTQALYTAAQGRSGNQIIG